MSEPASRVSGRLSIPAYFGCVALVTVLVIVAAMQFRPAFAHDVRQLLGLERDPRASPVSFYAVRVAPLFESRCAGCHGEKREKAQLRLDSFAAVMRGGRHGAAIQPDRPQDSELYRRITLPESDDKAMPPSGKPSLTKDEVTVIRLWIAAGASGTLPVGAIKGAPRPVVEVVISEADPRAVRRQRAALALTVRQLQASMPGLIEYESRGSADLDVDASLKGAGFGDAQLQALAPLRARIVRADFSGTAITDASAPALAAMTSLKVLRLANIRITDATIGALAPLKTLRSLTVTGSGATANALAPLRQKGVAIYGGGNAR
ncbi:MAG TPA: c-type cytochrome domain-containing protein [Rhizomicrobium sp.]|nr:c-type cytochrome domain-containing protein [Rhizomicrobium sp.]